MEENESKVVFETTDPRGNIIFLMASTYDEKIIINHPELSGEEKHIKKTIENPDDIFEDKHFSETNNYYRKHNSSRLNPFGTYIKVCVDVTIGRIKTAFITSKYKTEGNILYTKND